MYYYYYYYHYYYYYYYYYYNRFLAFLSYGMLRHSGCAKRSLPTSPLMSSHSAAPAKHGPSVRQEKILVGPSLKDLADLPPSSHTNTEKTGILDRTVGAKQRNIKT